MIVFDYIEKCLALITFSTGCPRSGSTLIHFPADSSLQPAALIRLLPAKILAVLVLVTQLPAGKCRALNIRSVAGEIIQILPRVGSVLLN